jgi:sulfonate transport system permease protein
MQAFRTLPIFALLPLFVVWVGIGQASKLDMIAFATSFPIYINLYAGIRGIDPKLLEAARTLRLSRLETLRHIVIPGTMAAFLVGLRFATATAWLVLVVVEQVNASSGIGFLMANAESYLEVNIIVVGLVIYAALGLLSDSLVRFSERRVLAWR